MRRYRSNIGAPIRPVVGQGHHERDADSAKITGSALAKFSLFHKDINTLDRKLADGRVEGSPGSNGRLYPAPKGQIHVTAHDPEGNPVVIDGKFMTIWKKQADGAWKIAVDMFNTDGVPPAGE